MDWSLEEVEAIVADYLDMLTLELAGQHCTLDPVSYRASLG